MLKAKLVPHQLLAEVKHPSVGRTWQRCTTLDSQVSPTRICLCIGVSPFSCYEKLSPATLSILGLRENENRSEGRMRANMLKAER